MKKIQWLFPGLLLSSLLLSLPAQAAKLQSWRFEPSQNQLTFTTDEDVEPTAQLLANPTRLVIDLPGIALGRPKINQSVGGVIQGIRIGQFNAATTRLVVELAPGYTIDPRQVIVRGQSSTQWSVQLPQPQRLPPEAVVTDSEPQPVAVQSPPVEKLEGPIVLGQELAWLQDRIQTLRANYPALKSGLFFLDVDTGNYLDINGNKTFPTASIIKLPILIAFFQDVDAGKIRLDETLVMRPELIASGSGTMQDLPAWSKFSALKTATQMIVISDNTATNMIIHRMGGISVLNQRFRSWGLKKTVIRNWLPDLSGTNTTTAREMVYLLSLLDQRKLLSPQSQDEALGILRRTKTRTLLPAGLGTGATIAHKTGDIGFMLGDAGIIELPNGKRYLGAVLVIRPYNDIAGRNFIRQVSGTVYSYMTGI
ncbi:serine hydrolase [Leptolyngbya sp. 'hensonii']|uniref:serine hydrolase n=1 Tax=Leptolyngbya sp. 'hensonii' TaxID=1922337 RepID=UPI00094FC745|nr:serine hydrolase [Leptolyngbya sp. 'hensonii']OLP17583.1 serine hydrolase [Leptolyngbya sp. 'hensonii']